MIKYQVKWGEIVAVNIQGETAKFWIFDDQRKHRKGGWDGTLFDSWQEAKAHRVLMDELALDQARQNVLSAERHLDETRAMKQPEGGK
jgi:hypothetical protein